MAKGDSFRSNKNLFYQYYEKNDLQRALLYLSKFDKIDDKKDLQKYYYKWKKDDRARTILSILVVVAVPLFLYILVKWLSPE